jgi:hypothetical protein
MGKKVLVHSRYRNPLTRTTREWERGKDGKLQEINGYRQFVDHRAYMTPKEAAFIVDSEENMRAIEGGLPPFYSYPAGSPLIIDEMKDGPLSPPMAQGGIVANNPQQVEAARRAMAEGEAQLAARDAGIADRAKAIRGSQTSAAQRIERPPESEPEQDKSRPLVTAGASGAAPLRISNPDLPSDVSLDAPPDFGP